MLELPVASPWYVRSKAGESVSLVSEPHVHRFLRCNVWHVRGRDRDLVVDTALGLAPLRIIVEEETDNDLVAVATHTHPDHVGGLWEFDHRLVHEAEAEAITVSAMATVATDLYPESCLGPYRQAGCHFDPLLIDAVPEGGRKALIVEIKAAPATRVVAEGDVVDLGDRAFEVLHLRAIHLGVSACGKHRPVCCFPAMRSMTVHCSTISTKAISTTTKRPFAASASFR